MLAITFANKSDYDLVMEGDRIDINGLTDFRPGQQLQVTLHHSNGNSDTFPVNHTYNENQIEWFKAGSALNLIRMRS